jgi:site-specific DNA recombinase
VIGSTVATRTGETGRAQRLVEVLVGADAAAASRTVTALKAVAWARVSTDEQEERGLSIPEQLREIGRYADERGIAVVAEFHEAASAFRREDKRVEFHRMLDRAKGDPDISAILIHDFSRFSRDSVRAKSLVRELRAAGVRVISLNDPDIDPETVAGVYMEAITYAKNEAYSREIAFHTRKGCRSNLQTRDEKTGWCYKNGGQPLWGYRIERLERGQDKRGRPIYKSIWVLDETTVDGRPVHEWVRHCLVELAANGASLDELREFCNERGLPARRGKYWSSSTWNSLLTPHALLQYCGFGVWNVHRKNGSIRPASEWVVVENAHPAIITQDEATAITAVRRGQSRKRFATTSNRSCSSPYLLSGGLFTCGRCGANMTGLRLTKHAYYVCGSLPYRKGRGCGPGVYVPQAAVEAETIKGLRELLAVCRDPKAFTRQVNKELRALWERGNGRDPDAANKLEAVEAKIANIRCAVEDGLSDAAWANARLRELLAERDALKATTTTAGEPPQIDADTVLAYRRDAEKTLAHGTPFECKQVLRAWVQEVKLEPERLEVEIAYRVPPELFMNGW